MVDARSLVRAALLVIVALILYAAFQKATWYPGRETSSALSSVIALADEMNAGLSADELTAKATVNGEIDVAKLRELLLEPAKKAGQLKRLEAELRALSEGREYSPAAARSPSSTSQSKESKQRPSAAPGTSGQTGAKPAEIRVAPPAPVVPPDPIYRVAATQDSWAIYEGFVPPRDFTVRAVGWIKSTSPTRGPLIAPEAPRFAPVIRLCFGPECHLTVPLKKGVGAEYSAGICELERGTIDRVEIWYNDVPQAPRADNTGYYDFKIEESPYSCDPARRICLQAVITGLNKPSTCR